MGGSSGQPALNEPEPEPVPPRTGLVRRAALAGAGARTARPGGLLGETVAQLKRLGLPEPASDRAPYIFDLWIGTWIAAGIIGVGMWGLILWAALRFKTRHNEMPQQNRYNLPMEIFYTIAPFIIIGVLFYYTILAQNKVLADDGRARGRRSTWSGRSGRGPSTTRRPTIRPSAQDVYEAGTINKTPTLYLPVNKSVRFNLSSPDVIHSFWIPAFYRKLDVVPGRNNFFDADPDRGG